MIANLTTGVTAENANHYIDAYAELMSICKEYFKLNNSLENKSFSGTEECPGAIERKK